MSFKLTYNAFILGERINQQNDEFLQALEELEHQTESGCYIGMEGTNDWLNRIMEECPQILSIGRDKKDVSIFSINLLLCLNHNEILSYFCYSLFWNITLHVFCNLFFMELLPKVTTQPNHNFQKPMLFFYIKKLIRFSYLVFYHLLF